MTKELQIIIGGKSVYKGKIDGTFEEKDPPGTSDLNKLLTVEGFIAKYFEMRSEFKTNEETYEAVEGIYENAFGGRKYASFQVFKNILTRFKKNEKSN